MRIAIVGSGVAGLVAAALLHRKHEITVFEAADRAGGHVNTISVPGEDGQDGFEVDTGFIVYNEANYPLFTRLLSRLGVASQPTDMGFSVRCHRTGLEYNGSSLRQIFVQKRNLLDPSFHRMLRDIVRFNRAAPEAVRNGSSGLTLGEYLERARFSPRLAEHYLEPMGSALWSVPRRSVLEMPAAFFVRFFEQHGMLQVDGRPQWRVVQGGSRRYVDALVAPFRHRIRLRTPVREVRRLHARVAVNGETFDQVVLACHSDQALALLADPTPQERAVLGALRYQRNEVVLHTDSSVLPRRRAAWAAWNYALAGGPEEPASVTYNMNLLQDLSAERTYCVTLNPVEEIDPASVLYRTEYHHPVYTLEGMKAQSQRNQISGIAGTHYCGAYWGFGFHEDGVRSGIAVAHSLGAEA